MVGDFLSSKFFPLRSQDRGQLGQPSAPEIGQVHREAGIGHGDFAGDNRRIGVVVSEGVEGIDLIYKVEGQRVDLGWGLLVEQAARGCAESIRIETDRDANMFIERDREDMKELLNELKEVKSRKQFGISDY